MIRRDADIDCHALLADVSQVKIVRARRGINDRVGPDRERRIEGCEDARQYLVVIREKPVERINTWPREDIAMLQQPLLQIRLHGHAVA